MGLEEKVEDDDVEVGYLVPDRDDGVRFISEDEYEKLIAVRLEKG